MHTEKLRQLYLKIRDVNTLSQKHFSQILEDKGITPVQFGVLVTLTEDEAMTMTKLYKLVGCVPSNMTTLINRMVREQLVRTTKNPEDQRQTLVFLTQKGMELRNSLTSLYQSFLEANFKSLSDKEQATLLDLLIKLEKDLS
ncbi:MarR family winged helix-turn-helix transcriptional regulator [Ammoniphilus resinae]|uniref:DNA-binding MarR family transcriptional regulator n=1 Tax=Ammoniphilus resinae TaxID=861532 RepID=A0ABS4GVX5_9BACL|nr:MarR family transcriptional regulator [Ammoniphilus resinae]MBP1934430.1 DNA-binding MarR family transcriptional regulator [Ammoniphilus resinae]